MDVRCPRILYVWLICQCLLAGSLAVNKQNIYSSGCSGERINLVCPENHKIAIKRLFYGIKNDARCSGNGRHHSVDCCQPTHSDCLVVDDRKYPVLNMLCSGQRGCDIAATSIESGPTCHAKGYGNMTNYMSVIHDCIPDDDIIPLCSNSHKRGKRLYLANAKYPLPLAPGKKQCQCLIKTGNRVGIDIHALDVIITRTESGNHCYQDIEIRDDEGHRKEITCGHPGLYAFRNIYNSDVRSVTLTLNNRAPKAQGYIWIQAKAKEDSDFVEMYCGDEMLKRLGYVIPGDTESRTVDSVDNGSKEPTLTPAVGVATNSSKEGTPNVMSDLMELFIGIGVAIVFVIILGVAGIIILCVRRGHRRKRPVQQPPPFPSPIMKNKENNHSSNTYCHYDYDEDKYCSIKRSPMKMSKYSDMNRNAGKKLKEAFSQGMASNESMDQNGYVNYLENVHHLEGSQSEPLLQKSESDNSNEDTEDEVIMPQSQFITIGKAIQPRTIDREQNVPTLPQKKKMKNKTVTFSPVAMVTPLPSGSDESVPEELGEDAKANYLEMYSKTMPSRSPDKVKKIIQGPGTQDDMCIGSLQSTDCENVTEEDLWKAFHIKLSDSMSSDPEMSKMKEIELKEMQEDPDYDENPYDNLPYMNIGSLRRHNTPETKEKDMYREIIKRNFSHEPAMASIPEY